MNSPTNSTLSPTSAVVAACSNPDATDPLRNPPPHVATRWPTARLPRWQSERQAADRPIGTWRNLGKLRHAGTAAKLVRVCFDGPNATGGNA